MLRLTRASGLRRFLRRSAVLTFFGGVALAACSGDDEASTSPSEAGRAGDDGNGGEGADATGGRGGTAAGGEGGVSGSSGTAGAGAGGGSGGLEYPLVLTPLGPVDDNSAYVSVFFSVTDQRGEPISGLGMQDFEINEDGDPVDPVATSLRIAPAGDLLVPTVLLLDASSRTTDTFTSVRDAAHRVIESAMPNQPIAVVTFAESYELVQDFTTDKALLDDAVDAASIVPFEQADLMSALDYTYGRWNDGDRLSAITNQSEITAGVLIVVTEGDDTANTFSLFEVLKGRSNKRTLLLTLADIDPDRAKLIGNMGVFAANEDRSNLAQVVDALLARLALLNQAVYRAEYCSTLRSLEVRLALSLPANMGVDANPVPEGRCAPVEENAECTQDYLSCPLICCPISRPYYCDGSPGDCYGTLEEAMAVCGSECLACGLGSIGQYQTTAGPIIARYLQTSEFRDAQCDEFLGGGQGGAGGQGP